MKSGAMAFSLTATGCWAFHFTPDDDFGNTYKHCLPFRKEPRDVKEEVAGFLWADAADFQTYGGWALDTQHVGFMGSSYLLAARVVVPGEASPSAAVFLSSSLGMYSFCGCWRPFGTGMYRRLSAVLRVAYWAGIFYLCFRKRFF